MAKGGGSLFSRLVRGGGADKRTDDIELHIDCDDIQTIWARFPGLAPGVTRDSLPPGLLLVDDARITELAALLPQAADTVAAALAGPIDRLKTAWTSAQDRPAWTAVCDILIGGLGLGCAVPREVVWRGPAVFALTAPAKDNEAPPFLRLVFLPGAGSAGLALVAASATAPVDRLVARSAGSDWAQTWQSYTSPDDDMTAYGLAGQALVAAGVLRRRGVSLQARSTLAAPVIGRQDLASVETPWRRLITAAKDAVNAQEGRLDQAINAAFPGALTGARELGDGTAAAATACDYFDVAYFVLADLIYSRIAEGARTTGRQAGRPSKINAVVLDRPSELWHWLIQGEKTPHGQASLAHRKL